MNVRQCVALKGCAVVAALLVFAACTSPVSGSPADTGEGYAAKDASIPRFTAGTVLKNSHSTVSEYLCFSTATTGTYHKYVNSVEDTAESCAFTYDESTGHLSGSALKQDVYFVRANGKIWSTVVGYLSRQGGSGLYTVWSLGDKTFTFRSDGTMTAGDSAGKYHITGTYTVSDSVLTLKWFQTVTLTGKSSDGTMLLLYALDRVYVEVAVIPTVSAVGD